MPDKVVTLASTTSSQAELEHAASENWRQPFTSPVDKTTTETEPAASTEGKSATESETVPAGQQQQNPETKPKPKTGNGYERRIDKLTARNKAIETEAARLRAENDELKRRPAGSPPQQEAAAPKPALSGPKLADYATAEEWADARADWQRTQERQREESSENEQEARTTWEAHNGRISEARAKYEDFDEVAEGATIPIPQQAALAIIEQSNSGDIAYYLAKHPDEAKALADMRPMKQIAAIVKISDKLSATPVAAAAAPKVKPASQAPAPIKPVGGAATGSTVELGSLSYQDYRKARQAGRR